MEQFWGIVAGALGTVAIIASAMLKSAEAWPSDWYWFARITAAVRPFVFGCVFGAAVSFNFLVVSPNGRAFTIWAYLVSGLAALALLVKFVDAYHQIKRQRGDDETDR